VVIAIAAPAREIELGCHAMHAAISGRHPQKFYMYCDLRKKHVKVQVAKS
jgi:hypothetical protein